MQACSILNRSNYMLRLCCAIGNGLIENFLSGGGLSQR